MTMCEKEYVQVNQDDNNPPEDYIVKTIGGFGKWQAIVCLVSSVSRFIIGVNVISIIFLAPRTEFTCVKFKSNKSVIAVNSTCYDECEKYIYYDTIFEDTWISRFGLICENEWLASFTQSILILGLLIGVPTFGWISDRFGRRKAYLSSTFVAMVFMIASPFSPNYWVITVMRCFCGFGTGGIMTLSMVICMEIVGPLHKGTAGFIIVFIDVVSGVAIKLIAYFSPTWDIFLLSCGLIAFVLFLTLFFITESPRWLIANKKKEEAFKALSRIAKFNKLSNIGIKEIVSEAVDNVISDNKGEQKRSYIDLFRSKKIFFITMNSVSLWFITGICYFGISQYSTFLGLSVYLVMYITGFLEVLITFVAMATLKYVKRRLAIVCNLVIMLLSMLILIFIPFGHWGCIVFTSIAVGAAKLVFSIIYVQTNELYPTPLRNMGLALSTAGSEFGVMFSPFLANARPYWAPSVIFAVLPVIALVISVFLPETKGKQLEDTVD